MARLEIIPEGTPSEDPVFELLDRVSNDRKAILNLLVSEAERIVGIINAEHASGLILALENHTSGTTDSYGWELNIRQRYIDSDVPPEDDDDPYFPTVAVLKISELEVNSGKPMLEILEYLDDRGKIKHTSFGHQVSLDPKSAILYLRSISVFGNARPKLIYD